MRSLVERRGVRLTVAFPSSILSKVRNDLVATLRLAEVARAAAIFRVDELLIYLERDRPLDRSLQRFTSTILDYITTPQYIRKGAFGMSRRLRYAGALPPLRTPNQLVPASEKDVRVGDLREGLVTRVSPRPYVDIGLESQYLLNVHPKSVKLSQRGLFRIANKESKSVERASWDDLRCYWRYFISSPALTLGKVLESRVDCLKIATSRYGEPVWGSSSRLRELRETKDSALIAFGSPSLGLNEILAGEKINVRDAFDLTLNTATKQGVATVRTEEAILVSLAVLNEILD